MQSKTVWAVIYLSANVIAALIFWAAVSAVNQTAKMDDGPDGFDFGDVLNFEKSALPILLVSLLFNLAFGIKALIDVFRRKYLAISACGIACMMWFTVISILRTMG